MGPLLFYVPTSLLAGVAVFASQTDPLVFLLNYGVLGAIVILAATGFISFKPHVDALNKRIDAQAAIITEFQIASRTATTSMGRTADVLEALPQSNGDVSVHNLEALVSRLEELAGEDEPKRRR